MFQVIIEERMSSKDFSSSLRNILDENNCNYDSYTFCYSFMIQAIQRVTLNGKTSDWECIRAGVPQGSILGPLFFLIYINDLATDLKSNIKLFADNTSLFSSF